MRKLVLSLTISVLFGFAAMAQVSGTMSGTLVDAQQNPLVGTAVFYYGDHSNLVPSPGNLDVHAWINVAYTDNSGNYSINYWGYPGDTVTFGSMDCQNNLTWQAVTIDSTNLNKTRNLQINGCIPLGCDALTNAEVMTVNSQDWILFKAVSLRDSFSAPSPHHVWSFNGTTHSNGLAHGGHNYDTVLVRVTPNMPSVMSYCYQRWTGGSQPCAQTCDSVVLGTTPNPLNCNASYYVDSVNSLNFQGQIVAWENSTADSGATITDYSWDFGDGSAPYNSQYPSHTYSDTGVYSVCLTITAVRANDTCTSTFCDSVGFDSDGNLVYKQGSQGFTINIVDPATIGRKELSPSEFSLYPNPNNGRATLSWDEGLNVKSVEVISVSGQRVRNIAPTTSEVILSDLQKGAYIVRINAAEGASSLKMIVK